MLTKLKLSLSFGSTIASIFNKKWTSTAKQQQALKEAKEASAPLLFSKTMPIPYPNLYGLIITEENPLIEYKLSEVSYNLTMNRYEAKCSIIYLNNLNVHDYKASYPQVFVSPVDVVKAGELLLLHDWELDMGGDEALFKFFIQKVSDYYNTDTEYSESVREKKIEQIHYFMKDWRNYAEKGFDWGDRLREIMNTFDYKDAVKLCPLCHSKKHVEEECPFKG